MMIVMMIEEWGYWLTCRGLVEAVFLLPIMISPDSGLDCTSARTLWNNLNIKMYFFGWNGYRWDSWVLCLCTICSDFHMGFTFIPLLFWAGTLLDDVPQWGCRAKCGFVPLSLSSPVLTSLNPNTVVCPSAPSHLGYPQTIVGCGASTWKGMHSVTRYDSAASRICKIRKNTWGRGGGKCTLYVSSRQQHAVNALDCWCCPDGLDDWRQPDKQLDDHLDHSQGPRRLQMQMVILGSPPFLAQTKNRVNRVRLCKTQV